MAGAANLIDRFAGGDGDGLVETQTGAVVAVCVDIGKYRDEEFWLLTLGGEGPSLRLAKLEKKS